MSGYESNRFIDLSERYAKHLICSICLNIYNNAVKSECEHTFCKSCVENWIKHNHRECPECRTGFPKRKRTTGMRSDLNLVIVSNFVFKKNLTANNMINEFKIKCDNELNGCPKVFELASLSEHLKNCEHWLCPKCQFIDRSEGHDCFERMKTDRNNLNVKLKEIESKNSLLEEKIKNNEKKFNEKLNEMKAKNKRLEEKLINKTNELNVKNSLLEEEIKNNEKKFNEDLNKMIAKNKTVEEILFKKTRELLSIKLLMEQRNKANELLEIENKRLENQLKEINLKFLLPELKNFWKKDLKTTLRAQSIYFGTYLTLYSTIKFSFNFWDTFVYFSTNPEFKKSKDYENYGNFSSNIKGLEELKFCSDSEFPVIILKLKSLKSCDDIREAIKLSEPSKGWFDIESKDIKERYITIKVCPQTTIGYSIIGYLMSVLLITGYIETPLKCELIDVNEAKTMFNRVSNNWFNEDSDLETKQDSDSEDKVSTIWSSKNKRSVIPVPHPEKNLTKDQHKPKRFSSYHSKLMELQRRVEAKRLAKQ